MKPMAIHPVQRSILAVDIENSTRSTNTQRAGMRDHMYVALDKALRAAGIPPAGLDRLFDRGDGYLAFLHLVDEAPMTALLGGLVPELADYLRGLSPEDSFRLRVALHAGGVHYDRQGCFGEEVDVACRLLDAPAVKRTLHWVSAPLVLAITDSVHRSVVPHDYPGIDAATFERIPDVRVGEREVPAWIHVPGNGGRW